MRKNKLASDKALGTVTGKIINGKTLQNMKVIRKFSPNEKDLKESTVQTELMRDFPAISKEENSEVLVELIAAYAKESRGIILDDDTPDILSEERGLRLMLAQKLLVLKPRNLRRTSLKHPTSTACMLLLLLLRGKEVKENPL